MKTAGASEHLRVENKQAVLLALHPADQLEDRIDGHGLGHQRAEARVQLEARRHLQKKKKKKKKEERKKEHENGSRRRR